MLILAIDGAARHCLLQFYFPRKLSGFSADRSNFNVTQFKYVIAGSSVRELKLCMIVPYSSKKKANVYPPLNKWRVKNNTAASVSKTKFAKKQQPIRVIRLMPAAQEHSTSRSSPASGTQSTHQVETTWQTLCSRPFTNKEINIACADKVWEIPHKNINRN